jgi:hypothetical protein
MPCPLTSDLEYPDYVKKILKEIEVGNDQRLKDCACKLKTVVDEEGCPILDEDNKLGLFPFCITDTETDPTTMGLSLGHPWLNYPYAVGLSLDDMMHLFWRVIGYSEPKSSCTVIIPPDDYDPGSTNTFSSCGSSIPLNKASSDVKERVCNAHIGFSFNRKANDDDILYGNASPGCTINNHEDIAFFQSSNYYKTCYRYNDLYYPTIQYTCMAPPPAIFSTTQRAGGPATTLKLKINTTNYSVQVWYPLANLNHDAIINANLELTSEIILGGGAGGGISQMIG